MKGLQLCDLHVTAFISHSSDARFVVCVPSDGRVAMQCIVGNEACREHLCWVWTETDESSLFVWFWFQTEVSAIVLSHVLKMNQTNRSIRPG